MSHIKRDTGHHQKKLKISPQRLLSATLGAVLAYIVFHILLVERKGRQGLTTPEQWKQLIKSHPYERKPTDVRSPCPMLNTLANHGFIARDGRDIKLDNFFDAMMLMGAPPTITFAFLKYVFVAYKEASPTSSFLSQFQSLESLDLHRLFVPRIIEHDVSLSRLDQGISNQTSPVPKFVERMIKIAHYKNQGKLKHTFTRRNENDARRIRREGQLATKHLESFLLHERFPEDWYPRETPLGIVDVLIKPMDCWIGLHKSKADLRLLDQI
ncbi:Chloroperoxidase [Choanephora cucurbitarum]|uniref:Chloroperoxidase n=1 Tax=Choanephora cucurbitarum TaxID=101091 RepID=A0A1C7N2V4_9FUNG|nr:Chloroperoxidase [Choanephora cucurbitarum]